MSDVETSPDHDGQANGWDASPWWVLPVILAVAAGLRLWKLGSLPPAIFRDEAEKALNGWFLLNDGVDAAGRPWPVFIEVFGVTTSAIYQYATMPFLATGGLNEWTARLPSATAGMLTVLFTWLFARRVWGWQVAAWAAGLLAISPWHVPLSRWAQQGVFLPMLFAAAVWALAASQQLRITNYESRIEEPASPENLNEGRSELAVTCWFSLAAVCTGLAVYAYDPARLFAPLLALAALLIWWRTWVRRWRAVLVSVCVFLLVASPVIWLLMNQGEAAQARFRFLSVFQPAVPMGEGLAQFGRNYLSHFSPSFLLLDGDKELRHSGGVGMLNLVEFIFAIIGAGVAIKRRCRWGVFVIAWVLLAPVASSLTRVGVPHALRSQVAIPAWQLLAAVGIVGVGKWVYYWKRERTDRSVRPALGMAGESLYAARVWHQVLFVLAFAGAVPFLLSYYGGYAKRSAVSWQYGVRETLDFTSGPHTDNSTVFFKFVTGAEYLVPFYLDMQRSDYLDFMRGERRFKIVPFTKPDTPPDQVRPWLNVEGPAALASPLGLEQQPGWAPMPITVPGDEQMEPAMLLFLNQQLLEQVKEQSTN